MTFDISVVLGFRLDLILSIYRYKLVVAEALVETLKPIQREINALLNDKPFLISVLEKGADNASSKASETWKLVREKIGAHHLLPST